MDASRSAHHTIAGYHYQFDKSLIEILNTTAAARVTLEGIEDIDLSAQTIQCKYHSSQRYAPSRVRSPLLQFIKHYAGSRDRNLVYTLYAHFKEGAAPRTFSLGEFKALIGDALHGLGLSDSELATFLSDHLSCVQARDIEQQHDEALAALCSALNCALHDARDYFYGNALHEIIRLSRQSSVASRSTTKAAFLSVINKKCRLFSLWLLQLKGERNYQRHVRDTLLRSECLSPTKRKHFLLHRALAERSGVRGLETLCYFLIDRFFKVGTALSNAVPPTVIIDGDQSLVSNLKRALLERRVPINDGFEHISFQPWLFDEPPVIMRMSTRSARPTDKIGRSSYVLRIIGGYTYKVSIECLDKPHVLVATGPDLDPGSCQATETIHLHAVNSHETLIPILAG